jgi:hypothetical protein
MSGIAPFAADETLRLLHDPLVAAAGLAAARAIRDASLAPLAELAAAAGRTREIAFGVSLQGLGPRLATLPPDPRVPRELREHLDAEGARGAVRGERIVGLLARLAEILEAERLRAVPLKGAALLLGGIVPPGLRPMADVDLLFETEGDLRRAAARIGPALDYRPLWNTRRHLVLAEAEEKVVLPACEHPENPLRIELHRSFRLDVLGRTLDATGALRRGTGRAGAWDVPGDDALLLHLLFHAAEDFAAKGLRGVQSVDFLLLARRLGPLSLPAPSPAPVVLAARAVEGLFPGTFDAASLAGASAAVRETILLRAASIPALRHARGERGWTMTALGLVDGGVPATRFLLRTLFPTLDEVKANVAPGATGPALAAAWLRVLSGRLLSAVRGVRGR